jgi:release factor glutamine methyltransferase
LGEILKRSEEFLARKGVENSRGDARRLLAHGLGITPMKVMLQFDRPLEDIEGTVGFRHLSVACDGRALVPRPETEEIVDLALARLPREKGPRVHEVGVGTGCVCLSMRHERADLRVTGSDISVDALTLARQNADRLGIWVPLWRMDLLAGFRPDSLDMVVSNPPYIASREIAGLSREVKADPRLALDGGPDGLDLIRILVRQAREVLKPGGWLLVEHGFDQGASTRALCGAGWTEVSSAKDLSGQDRFLVAAKATDS